MIGQKSESSQTVMVVEDDLIISALLKHMLARRGFEVHLASDGRQASAMVEELTAPPGLVMLDVMLPFVDGFDLITLIRNKQEWKDVPIIMLTSKAAGAKHRTRARCRRDRLCRQAVSARRTDGARASPRQVTPDYSEIFGCLP